MNITIRNEKPEDYRIVEELTREAFWGCMDHSTCDGEHLLLHKLRKLPTFVQELDFVAEADGIIVGSVVYCKAAIEDNSGRRKEVLTFGPLSVLPEYKRKGVGSALMRHSIDAAKELGYSAIVFFGHPDYYPRFGFKRASSFGVTASDAGSYDALMAMELISGSLSGGGRFFEDEVYNIDAGEAAEFDKTFAHKEPVELLPISALAERLPADIQKAFDDNGVSYVSNLLRFSGREMLEWDGVDTDTMIRINDILSELGFPRKIID